MKIGKPILIILIGVLLLISGLVSVYFNPLIFTVPHVDEDGYGPTPGHPAPGHANFVLPFELITCIAGLITAIAGLITAITGFILALKSLK